MTKQERHTLFKKNILEILGNFTALAALRRGRGAKDSLHRPDPAVPVSAQDSAIVWFIAGKATETRDLIEEMANEELGQLLIETIDTTSASVLIQVLLGLIAKPAACVGKKA